MLQALHIKNLALINEARLAFSPGMTCITGESGSGKTAFLHGIQLVAGERAQSDWIRDGATQLEVQAQFTFTSQDAEDACIVKRTFGETSQISIDGEMANAKMLAATVGASVDFCGQHEHQLLLSAKGQKNLLFDFDEAHLTPLAETYNRAFSAYEAAATQLHELAQALEADGALLDQARYQLDRITEVNPLPNEDVTLEEELLRLEAADALMLASEHARAAIAEESGAAEILNAARTELDHVATKDEALQVHAERLSSLIIELEDVASELRAYRDSIELDPAQLSAKQERLAALQGLMRAFGPTLDTVLETKERAEQLLSTHENSEYALTKAKKALADAKEELQKTATALAQAQKASAKRLGDAISQKLTALEMAEAHVEVHVELLDFESWSAAGPTHIEFFYTPSPSASARPLKKIASGGELSRVMLAAKAVESGTSGAQTLVFDEVDAGVGGTAALALARMLKELSATHQVICVTHLPQVAVLADAQFVVERLQTTTTFTQVSDASREREIARMLAGSITEESLAHARSLLQKHQKPTS